MTKKVINMTNQTYNATNTVNVDDESAQLLKEAEEWMAEAAKKQEEVNKTRTEQGLFELGAIDFLSGKGPNALLFENSVAYFQGYDFGQRLRTEILEEAKKRFPSPVDGPKAKVGLYANALIKKNTEIKEL